MDAERFGVSDAAKERGVLAIGNVIDTQADCPDTVVTSAPWHFEPTRNAALAAILFAAFDALQIRLQQTEPGVFLPYQLVLGLPFILSILALILMSRRGEVPAALLVSYNKGER